MKNEYGIPRKIAVAGFSNCYLSEIVILELMYGIENSASLKKAENMSRLKAFETLFEQNILSVRTAFDAFAAKKTALRKAGTPISDFDLIIGCTALAGGLTLVSRNIREMSRIEGLQLENWIDG